MPKTIFYRRSDAAAPKGTDDAAPVYYTSGRTVDELKRYDKGDRAAGKGAEEPRRFDILDILVVENFVARARMACDEVQEKLEADGADAKAREKFRAISFALDEFTRVVLPPYRKFADQEGAALKARIEMERLLGAPVG